VRIYYITAVTANSVTARGIIFQTLWTEGPPKVEFVFRNRIASVQFWNELICIIVIIYHTKIDDQPWSIFFLKLKQSLVFMNDTIWISSAILKCISCYRKHIYLPPICTTWEHCFYSSKKKYCKPLEQNEEVQQAFTALWRSTASPYKRVEEFCKLLWQSAGVL